MPERNASLVQSVERAIGVLELLAGEAGELGVTQVGRALGVHKATAFRLLATLEEHGLVEQNPETERYRLGPGLLRLAGAAASGMDLVRQARPVLERLADETRETVNLAVLAGDRVVNIDQVTAPGVIVAVNWVGTPTPLHSTANGKVFLAALPSSELDRLLAAPLERSTPRTVVDPDALRAELEAVRRDGFARTEEELEVGLNAIAAPVRGAAGDVVATVSVAGPAYRMTARRSRMLGRITADAAGEISTRLGFGDPAAGPARRSGGDAR